MKSILKIYGVAALLLSLIAGSSTIYAQIITTNPAFPTANDQVVITYDATQGNAALVGVAPPIYAHTGVITNLSTSSTDWRYVIAGWGENTAKAELTPLGNNKYTLTISPSIKAFYGVPDGETILQLAFVFRNANGSIAGKTATNGDIFTDVYAGGLNLNIEYPESGTLSQVGGTINFKADANNANVIEFYMDGTLVSTSTTIPYIGSVMLTTPGLHWLKFVASDQTNEAADSVWVYARGSVPVAPLPAGMKLGINYIDNQTATLVLHDPPALKQFVYVLGDFNAWLPSETYQMNRTPDGKHYWLTINNLTSGVEYAFQYWIDGELKLADPYTNKILDPWNDQYISATTYPNLKPYPAGKTTGVVSILQTNQPAYNWEVEQFDTPEPEDLVIYELHIRDFVATRDIKTVHDTLDYLQRLGVNAIELMPINEFEGNDSWGYNPAFYFAPDKAYGRMNDYKAFIDECHKRGIAVFIDMVLNHSYGLSPLLQMYFDPEAGEYGQPSASNPWYNQVCPNTEYCWGYDFNHQSAYTQAFVDSVNSYWIEEFKVDGFRFDFTKGFTNVVNNGWNYDASRINILKRMYNSIKAVKPDAVVILEHLSDNSEEKELAANGMLLWGNLNGAYSEASMGHLPNSDFAGISYKASSRNWTVPHLVGYMESHDEERCMFKNLTYGNSQGTYSTKVLATALKRQELTGALFFTVPGPKMIWQFGELGYDVSIDDPCRVCAKPLHWEYQNDFKRTYLYNVWSSLIQLRRSHDVFKTTNFYLTSSGAYKKLNLNHSTMNVTIVGNFDVKTTNGSPTFQHTGWWYNYFQGDSIQVTDVAMYLPLEAGEYRIYTDKRLAKPSIGTGITENTTGEKLTAVVYPNPANDQITVDFMAEKTDLMTLTIFDVNGRKVAEVVDFKAIFGMNSITVNTSGLTKGLYLLRLGNGSMSTAQRLVIQ